MKLYAMTMDQWPKEYHQLQDQINEMNPREEYKEIKELLFDKAPDVPNVFIILNYDEERNQCYIGVYSQTKQAYD